MRTTLVQSSLLLSWLLAAVCSFAVTATATSWNGVEGKDVAYPWHRGDTLSQALFQLGLGRNAGRYQIYGAKGWVTPNLARNPKVKDWAHLPNGTIVHLLVPVSIPPEETKHRPATIRMARAPTAQTKPAPISTAKDATNAADAADAPDAVATSSGDSDQIDDSAGGGGDGEALHDQDLSASKPTDIEVSDDAEHSQARVAPKPHKKTATLPLLILWVSCSVLGAAIVLFGWRRAERLTKERHVRIRSRLTTAAEVYLRTFGQMSIVDLDQIDPTEDYQRRVKTSLVEGLLTARPEHVPALLFVYEGLGHYQEALTMIDVTRGLDYRLLPYAKTQGFALGEKPLRAAFTDFVASLDAEQPVLAANLRALLADILQTQAPVTEAASKVVETRSAPSAAAMQVPTTPSPRAAKPASEPHVLNFAAPTPLDAKVPPVATPVQDVYYSRSETSSPAGLTTATQPVVAPSPAPVTQALLPIPLHSEGHASGLRDVAAAQEAPKAQPLLGARSYGVQPAPAAAPPPAMQAAPAALVPADTSWDDASIHEELAKLVDLGGPELVEELVASFTEKTPDRLAVINAALVTKDLAMVAFEAHALRGTCGTLGAKKLWAALQEVETAAKNGDIAKVEITVVDLPKLVELTTARMEAFPARKAA